MPASAVIPESTSRLERKRAKNREALVGAARRLFAHQGYEETTIAQIAEAADLGFGTFYRYFPDKVSILEAVLEAGRREVDSVILDAELDAVAAPEALALLTAGFARAVRETHDVLALLWQVGVQGESADARRPRPGRVPPERALPAVLAGAICRIIERGIAAGDFREVDPVLMSRFIAAAHMYLLHPSALEIDQERAIEALRELELRTLAAPCAGAPARKVRGRNQ